MAALPGYTSTVENWCKTDINVVNFSYKWIITNFSKRPEKRGERLKSTTFSASHYDEYVWCLNICPKGGEPDGNCLGLSLELVSLTSVKINFKFSIIDNLNIRSDVSSVTGFHFYNGQIYGGRDLIDRKFIMDEANGALPDDTLTIVCDITMLLHTINTSYQQNVLKKPDCDRKLNQDIGNLFENDKFKDATLVVGDSEIKAHKNILSARSVVFEAMFAHDMEESKSNRVTITDFSYEVVQEMLRFIYTGKISNIDNIAAELLMAADKYALEDLKTLCEIELCGKLSIEVAVDMLVLADRYSADYLKAQAAEFISAHANDVLKTQGWQNMITSHTHLMTETVEAMIAYTKRNK